MIKVVAALALSAATVTMQANETTCLQREEAMAVFPAMLPAAVESMAAKCSNVLLPDAFLRNGAQGLAEHIRRDSKFEPGLLLRTFTKAGGGGQELPPGISETTLLMITNDVAKGLLVQQTNERGSSVANDLIEAIAPLPTPNVMKPINGVVALVPDRPAAEIFRICTNEG